MRVHRFLAGLFALSLLTAPLIASAQAQPDIQTQIAQLLSQIAALTSQLVTLQSATSSAPAAPPSAPAAQPRCPTLGRTLSLGARGDDVLSLQYFLNDEQALASDALTGYFGQKTESAVRAWQVSRGVASSGDASSTGWGIVGPKTQSAIASSCGGKLSAPGSLGASLAVSQAPASLSASATVRVNTSNACSAQTYALDWGDETPSIPITVPAGTCLAQTTTLTHSYGAPGYYTVTIGSGASSVSARVQVAQVTRCEAPTFLVNNVPAGKVGAMYSLPLISFPDTDTSLTLASTPLPSGLSLVDTASIATTTGLKMHLWALAGTSTVATTTNVTVSANNSCGTAQISFTLPVNQ